MAVDPAGVVWVYQESGEIDDFDNGIGNTFLAKRPSAFGTSEGFAVDGEDNLYVDRGAAVFGKLTSAGAILSEEVDSERSTAAAVNAANNEVLIDTRTGVAAYDHSGALLGHFGGAQLSGSQGLAVDGADGKVYVSDASADAVDVYFDPALLPTPVTGGASNVQTSSATLNGTVNPDGQALTSCEFEYGTETSYGQTAPCEPAAGVDPGDSSEHAVTATITGLQEGVTYHYRLLAGNTNGVNEGSDGQSPRRRRP